MNESLKHETDTEDGLRKQVFHCDKAGPLGGAGSDNTAVRMFLNITAFRFFKKSFLAHHLRRAAPCIDLPVRHLSSGRSRQLLPCTQSTQILDCLIYLGSTWDIFDVCLFSFFPLFCGSFSVFSLIGKQHGKNGTKLLRTETAIRQPPKCRVHCDACGSCQTLRWSQYLQSLWVRSILHFVYLCVMGISITHCQYGIPWYYNCDKYHLLQY